MTSEYQIQRDLLKWCESMRYTLPGIDRAVHIGNEGKRKKQQIGAYKAMCRFNTGFPDLFIPVPMHGYHGLMIELKISGNTARSKASEEQMEWLCYLSGQGYRAAVCKGLHAAQAEIISYYEGLI